MEWLEWAFIQSLQYHQDDEYSAEFVRSIYTVRLRKVLATFFEAPDSDLHLVFSASINTWTTWP
jgi:hypothetical protein